jgi:AraC-like DNA-binding protein
MPDDLQLLSDIDGPANSGFEKWFRMPDAAQLVTRGLEHSSLAVTEIRYDGFDYGMTDPVVNQDAFTIGLQLRPYKFHELWYEGRARPVHDVRPGDTLLFDLRTVQAARLTVPFHSLQFFLSRALLKDIADDLESAPIDEIRCPDGRPVTDPVIARLGNAARPALAAADQTNELFASHLMLSLSIYVCATYGNLKTPRRMSGGLSAWQERTAKEMIEAYIDGSLPLARVAAACGLSTSRFAHAFKASVGMAPHKWLLLRRVDRAKALLQRGRYTLSDVALACGFADQSHFTRVFRRATGATPGEWKLRLS